MHWLPSQSRPNVSRGVSLDRLLGFADPTVLDPVPEDKRNSYSYWRGVHLGALACNLLKGAGYINAGDTIYIGARGRALYWANSLVSNPRSERWQFGSAEASRLETALGQQIPDTYVFPAMVVALRPDVPIAHHQISDECYDCQVAWSDLDPDSLSAVEELFEVPLLK